MKVSKKKVSNADKNHQKLLEIIHLTFDKIDKDFPPPYEKGTDKYLDYCADCISEKGNNTLESNKEVFHAPSLIDHKLFKNEVYEKWQRSQESNSNVISFDTVKSLFKLSTGESIKNRDFYDSTKGFLAVFNGYLGWQGFLSGTKLDDSKSIIPKDPSKETLKKSSTFLSKAEETLNSYISTTENFSLEFIRPTSQIIQKALEFQSLLLQKIEPSQKLTYLNEIFVKLMSEQSDFSSLKLELEQVFTQAGSQEGAWNSHDKTFLVTGVLLSVLKDKDPLKFNYLIDLVKRKEDGIWEKALVGLVLILAINLEKEPKVPFILESLQDISGADLKIKHSLLIAIQAVIFYHRWHYYWPKYLDESTLKKDFFWMYPVAGRNDLQQYIKSELQKTEDYSDAIKIISRSKLTSNIQKLESILMLPSLSNDEVLGFLEKKEINDHELFSNEYFYCIFLEVFLHDLDFAVLKFYGSEESSLLSVSKPSILEIIKHLIPQKNKAHYSLQGDYYLNFSNHADAIPLYKKAISIDPKDHPSINSLGICYQIFGKDKKALKLHLKVLKANPSLDVTYGLIGSCYYQLNKLESALQYMKLASDYNPQNINAYITIGIILLSPWESRKIDCHPE